MGGLQRGAPLRRGGPLTRRTPLRAGVPAKRRRRLRVSVPVAVAAALAARSGGRCEAVLVAAACWGRATERHHRITQKAGGRHGEAKAAHDRLSNLVHLCTPCHAWVTVNPAAAGELGLSLREWQSPPHEPVLRRGRLAYLDDEGLVHDFEEVGP